MKNIENQKIENSKFSNFGDLFEYKLFLGRIALYCCSWTFFWASKLQIWEFEIFDFLVFNIFISALRYFPWKLKGLDLWCAVSLTGMSNLRLQTVFVNTFLPVKHLAQPGTFEIKNSNFSIFSIIMEPGFCMFVTALRGWGSEMSTGMRDIHHPHHGARSQMCITTNTDSISNIIKFHCWWAPCIRKTWKPICLHSASRAVCNGNGNGAVLG